MPLLIHYRLVFPEGSWCSCFLNREAQLPRSTMGGLLREGHKLGGLGEKADPRSLCSPP